MKGSSSEIIIAGFHRRRGTAESIAAWAIDAPAAVRESLISQGVSGNRIQTVSFGLEMPTAAGHNEKCLGKNRRAEIGVVK